MIHKIFQHNQPNTIVTASKRQARFLIKQQRVQQTGLCFVNILSWDQWIKQMLYSHNAPCLLLNEHQALQVWQTVAQQRNPKLLSTQHQKLAKQAQRTRQITQEWCLENDARTLHPEIQQFIEYERHFLQHNAAHQYMDYYQLCWWLTQRPLRFGKPVLFYGFHQWTPLKQTILKQIKSAFKTLDFQRHHNTKTSKYEAKTAAEEIQSAVLWGKQHCTNKETAAIICPQLHQLRAPFEFFLMQHFGSHGLAFNLSIPTPIYDHPFIGSLVLYLTWHIKPLCVDDILFLIGNAHIYLLEPKHTSTLQKRLKPHRYSLKAFVNLLDQNHIAHHITHAPKTHLTHQDWLAWLACEALKWGEKDVVEQRLWDTLFTQLLSFHPEPTPQTLEEFLEALIALTKTLPAPLQTHEGLQILDTTEAMGLSFDHLWFMNLNTQVFPAPTRTYPWIDAQLQLQLPECNWDTQNQLHTCIFEILCAQALQTIVLSRACYMEDQAQIPSPFFNTNLPPMDVPIPSHEPIRMQPYQEWNLHPKHITSTVSVSLLDEWLKCPFRYFCRQQLRLTHLTADELGPSSALQSTVLHNALEKIYSQAHTNIQIEKTLKQALYTIRGWGRVVEESVFYALKTYLNNMLENDPPQLQTHVCELNITYTINDLEIVGRLDRLDHQTTVIDYKYTTSENHRYRLKHVTQDPPETLQIPVYMLAVESSKRFAWYVVQPRNFENVTSDESHDIVALKKQWKSFLLDTTNRIKSGAFKATPSQKNCQNCHFKTVCHVSC